jgi:Skp family chaperone for outer membrane proteins
VSVVNLERLVAESQPGKTAAAQLKTLSDRKTVELEVKARPLQELERKMAMVVPSEDRVQMQKQADRLRVEAERLAEDAERELAITQRTLQIEFERKVRAAVTQVAQKKGLFAVFAVPQPLILFADPSVDITDLVLKQLEADQAKPPEQNRPHEQ